MGRVKGKVVLVTGAASGVGRENAILLAAEGAKVVLTDVNEAGVQAVAAEIGDNAYALAHNIASEGDWQRVVVATLERFGRLDVLVNNAAILAMGTIESTTLEDWQKIQRVNAEGYFLGCKYGVQAMKQHGGAIINMASLAALAGMAHFCAYSASKGAVTALTRSVAAHCKQQRYNIRCNSVHPDGILTPMVTNLMGAASAEVNVEGDPMARMCLPRDIANLVLFLASDESRFINGSELRIDNGQLSIDS
ncbi:SDR family oxidoreductase [Pseudoduganella ginsengisoli]|uniref:SDR family oxidoreductase n=1 Tax=Pseudoduganella ginsengisoli TaxID=1462440 RepID=A0A6L6PVW4_9BURK|nr:SDR family oxidoreductase [Pseudoduganella ginsengisoli]MTW01647.1 SDR family oxidoreductase [Pseudoduganella ginsengisoli]